GAVALFPTVTGIPCVTSQADLEKRPAVLAADRTNLMTIHLTSTCPMGENRARCAVDSFGKVHRVDNLYLTDASLLCGPPGVNPQGSIMAVARRNAWRFLGRL